MLLFGQLLEKLGLLFMSTSGHTGANPACSMDFLLTTPIPGRFEMHKILATMPPSSNGPISHFGGESSLKLSPDLLLSTYGSRSLLQKYSCKADGVINNWINRMVVSQACLSVLKCLGGFEALWVSQLVPSRQISFIADSSNNNFSHQFVVDVVVSSND